MSNCNNDLRKRGRVVPASCARCGRGPCRNVGTIGHRSSMGSSDSFVDVAVGAAIGSALSSVFDSAPDTTISDYGSSSGGGSFID